MNSNKIEYIYLPFLVRYRIEDFLFRLFLLSWHASPRQLAHSGSRSRCSQLQWHYLLCPPIRNGVLLRLRQKCHFFGVVNVSNKHATSRQLRRRPSCAARIYEPLPHYFRSSREPEQDPTGPDLSTHVGRCETIDDQTMCQGLALKTGTTRMVLRLEVDMRAHALHTKSFFSAVAVFSVAF